MIGLIAELAMATVARQAYEISRASAEILRTVCVRLLIVMTLKKNAIGANVPKKNAMTRAIAFAALMWVLVSFTTDLSILDFDFFKASSRFLTIRMIVT